MAQPVKVNILGREFLVACPEDEKRSLLESASYLNDRMREIRDSGKIVGIDRIAVMAALNITHEMLQARASAGESSEAMTRITRLDRRMTDFLAELEADRH
jgi:cell division protein ZapA